MIYTDRTDRLNLATGLHATNIATRENVVLTHLAPSGLESFLYPYDAIDVPWVVWGSQTIGKNPRLNVYNLETRSAKSVLLPSTCPQNELPGLPAHLVASGGLVLFQNCSPLGYDIKNDQFFALPITDRQPPLVGLRGWAFAKVQLVWGDAYSGQTELYTAPITSSP